MKLKNPNILDLLERIDAFKSQVPNDLKVFFDSELWHKRARRELGVDLRDLSLRRDRASSNEALFESVRPVGLVGHIMPGNSDWTPLLAILESAVVGNKSWVKLPSGSDTSILEKQLTELGLNESVEVFTSRARASELYPISDAISAWGSENSLGEIRSQVSAQVRFIPWGHRISFAYMQNWSDQAAPLAEAIVKYEQQACSSPQVAYLEDATFEQAMSFAKELANELKKHSSSFPEIEANQWAELSNFSETHRCEAALRVKNIIEADDQTYRIVIDSDATFEASPLNRTIFIKTIKRDQINDVLVKSRRFLQSAGIACDQQELARISEELIEAGVSRVCPILAMQDAHPLESHDGEFSLARFVKRVTVHAPQLTTNIIAHATIESKELTPITNKNDFAKNCSNDGDYFFKSGGSSGKAILSPFKIADYHLQMQVAADGLIASGMNPVTDRCMNLFFGGGLYGGFLSFTDILEKTGAPQYPMAGYLDHDFVLDTIIEQKINVLLGMPSYLVTLFKKALERDLKLPVEKIYFGGEPFSKEQREWLQGLGVNFVRSASYGSVDAGPLGYQCQHSDGGVHHVNTTIQKIEIVNINEDKPVLGSEIGRVLVTSKARTSVSIKRYQLEDTARWVEGQCPCGDPSPRLELMGRVGDIFKFGGSFLNARKFAELSGAKKIQIILSKVDYADCMTVITDADLDQVRAVFLDQPDLYEVVELEKSCKLILTSEGFQEASSGKLPLLLDRRQ